MYMRLLISYSVVGFVRLFSTHWSIASMRVTSITTFCFVKANRFRSSFKMSAATPEIMQQAPKNVIAYSDRIFTI